MDSDKTSKQKSIGDTKKRIQKEFDEKQLFSWITLGKEIENYLSLSAIQKTLDAYPTEQCGKYELFPQYIEPYYNNFTSNKVPFANKVKENISAESVLDLEDHISKLYAQIKKWNK